MSQHFMWLSLVIVLCANHISRAESPRSFDANNENYDREIEASVVDVPYQGLLAEVDVGELEGLKSNKIRVVLTNDTNSDLEIGSPSASCGCMSVSLSKKSFPIGESIDLNIQFKPFKSLDSSEQIARVNIQTSTGENLAVNIKMKLAAYVGFPQSSMFFEISRTSDEQEIQVPIIITKPLEIEQVTITTSPSDSVKGLRIVENSKGKQVVVAIKNLKSENTSSLGFEIIAKTNKSSSPIKAYCIIEYREDVTILPRVQRLTEFNSENQETEPSKFFLTGNAVLRIKDEKLLAITDKEGKTTETSVVVSTRPIEGWDCEINTIRMSKGTYRVKYRLTPTSETRTKLTSIDFIVDAHLSSFELTCPVSLN